MSRESETWSLSRQAMILAMAVRRGIIPQAVFDALSAEATERFGNNSSSIVEAWREFERAEAARRAKSQKMPGDDPAAYVEVVVDPRMLKTNTDRILLFLREKAIGSAMPILVGRHEATAISFELTNTPVPMPLTHDLMKNILIDQFGVAVTKAVISEYKENDFCALLYMERDGEEMIQDCRPDDAIALALRFGAPIFVDAKLWTEVVYSEGTRKILEDFDRFSGQNE
ncbi:MAG: bifunctional nuclease family protein [Candidatus Liptonbacteria bacterium]|nr:bifunctional nuclease family protein [Candidatus Liptonbacteria bacterium]